MTKSTIAATYLATVSFLGAVLLLLITRNGLSVSPDSVSYLSAADNLIRGNGVSVSYTLDQPVPLTRFPPFYSLVVGSVAFVLGSEVTSAARWLNSMLFGATVFLAGGLIHASGHRLLRSLFGATIFMSSAPLIAYYSYALSEPLFLLLVLLGLLLLGRTLEKESLSLLMCTGFVFGLACLTRYVGIALVLTGVTILVVPRMLDPERGRERRALRDAAILSLSGVAPVMIWLMLTRSGGTGLADREMVFHGLTVQHVRVLLSSVTDLLLPLLSAQVVPDVPESLRKACQLSLAAVTLLAGFLMLRGGRRVPGDVAALDRPASSYIAPLIVFIVWYVVTILASRLFIDIRVAFDTRILLPAYACAVILAVLLAGRVPRHSPTSGRWKTSLLALIGILLLAQPVAGVIWIARNRNEPQGYSSAAWKSSPLIAEVAKLPRHTPIFSNMPDAILFITGRSAEWIPSKFNYSSGCPNPFWVADMDATGEILLERSGVVVFFEGANRHFLSDADELVEGLGLYVVAKAEDGRVFRISE